MSFISKDEIKERYIEIQDFICKEIEKVDGTGKFALDEWERSEGGGGLTRVLNDGSVLEKAGVNFSSVYGSLSELMRKNLGVNASEFFATGVSIVMHPNNPHVPIIHMNIRYFELDNGDYWFGGGIDLTPHYVEINQAAYFHKELRSICEKFKSESYGEFKKWADDYFYIPHRKETRGIGGIFYDHLSENEHYSKKDIFDFSVDLGLSFPRIYGYLIELNRNEEFDIDEKDWQLLRRGRYVEFNLVYDRGTKFGLYSDGRTESILMSLPKTANWYYNKQVDSNSKEARTLSLLKKGIDWINFPIEQ